jgi:N-acetylmuramoyl-L-alanine amidase
LVRVVLVAVCAVVAIGAGLWGFGPSGTSWPMPGRRIALAATSAPGGMSASRAASLSPVASGEVDPSGETTFVVVIDAGHQAHGDYRLEPIGPGSTTRRDRVEGGTSGIVTHVHESTINLRVALRLRDALVAAGIDAVMVRTTANVDIANSARAKIANAAHAALFIRIHCDGTARSVRGILMLVPARNRWTGPIVSPSAKAGRAILAATVAATGAVDRGVTPRGDLSGFNWSKVPSVLIELGNMKNAKEDRLLSTVAYQNKLVAGMATAVVALAGAR